MYDRFSSRVVVRLIRGRRAVEVDDFIALYNQIIDENDRIPAERISRLFLDLHRSPPNVRAIKRGVTGRPTQVSHLLFLAYQRRSCVGFLKAILCNNSRTVFVAYIGVREGRATNALLETLARTVRRAVPPAEFIAYEVTAGSGRRPQGRLRLFRHYARLRNYQVYEWPDYMTPDLEFDDAQRTIEYPSTLGIIRLAHTPVELAPEELCRVVEALYRGVYAETFDDDPGKNEQYLEYLSTVEDIVLERVRGSVSPEAPNAGTGAS